MANYSNIKDKIASSRVEGGGLKMIPEGQDTATYILRYLKGEIAKSKAGNKQVVFTCKIVARGKDGKGTKYHNKEEKLYYPLELPQCPWYIENLLSIMDKLGLDFSRIAEDMPPEGWNDVFDDMDEASKIDFEVEFKHSKNGKGFDKRVDWKKIEPITWASQITGSNEDAATEDEDDDETP